MRGQLFIHSYRKMLFGAANSMKRYIIYVVMAFTILMMSWEASAANAAIAGQSIPEQAIRLRILANSDSPADQLLKRKIRDAVVEQMDTWVTEPDDIVEARAIIRENLAEVEQLVQRTLSQYGYDYEYNVELGTAEFPTKLYGNQVYPAGEYEALRISIGAAEGQNWWCVLFPPLCFVDMASGGSEPVAKSSDDVSAASAKPMSEQETEARFFLWDMLQNVFDWIGSWFEA